MKREYPRPYPVDCSWSLHSPAWSQIGQSSGWLMRRNSITPSRHSFTIGVVVRMCRPGETLVAHAIVGRGLQLILCLPVAGSMTGALVAGSTAGMPISTRHILQLPTTVSFGW